MHLPRGRILVLAALLATGCSGVVPVRLADAVDDGHGGRLSPHPPVALAQRDPTHPRVASRTRPAALGAGTPIIGAQVSANQVGQAMPPGFLGFSLEYRALHQYIGRDPGGLNPVFEQLVRNLNPGQSPVLRIGGDSTDQTWWPIPGMIPPGGITYALTDGWLRTARALAGALGARLILGINLASDRPAIAAAEARALVAGIGRRYIEALEIGNEADVYNQFAWFRDRRDRVVFSRPRNYTLENFIADFARWRSVLPAGVPVAGPAFATLTWMNDLQSFLTADPGLAVITFHRYALRGCESDPTAADYASIPNLLADSSAAGVAAAVGPVVGIAHAAGEPFRLDELNSAACAGKTGVSNTFSAALWMLDTLFNLAATGVDGVNIHTLPHSSYAPFEFTHDGAGWSSFVHPDYYGLLMFSQAFPVGARLLQVTAPSGPVKVWATQTPDGHVRVMLINKDPITPVFVHLQIPATQAPASAVALRAPSLDATSGVTLGGATFGQSTTTGTLPRMHPTTVLSLLGYYSVAVPAGSAVLLTR